MESQGEFETDKQTANTLGQSGKSRHGGKTMIQIQGLASGAIESELILGHGPGHLPREVQEDEWRQLESSSRSPGQRAPGP